MHYNMGALLFRFVMFTSNLVYSVVWNHYDADTLYYGTALIE